MTDPHIDEHDVSGTLTSREFWSRYFYRTEPPAHIKDLTDPQILAADWIRTDDVDVKIVDAHSILAFDPRHLEAQLVHLDRREAKGKSPQDREGAKRRRAGLVLDLGLRQRTPAEREAAPDNCRHAVEALPQKDGHVLLDMQHFKEKIIEHMQAEKQARAQGDEEEAGYETECVDALCCVTANHGIAANLGKWRAEINPPT